MDKYFFIHIPKTAGVKIRANLHMNANFPHTKLFIPEEGDDLRYVTDTELNANNVISGHFGYALRRRLDADWRALTVLRNPVERIISGYYYWKTLPAAPLSIAARELPIYDFARSDNQAVLDYVDNAQTWQLFSDYARPTRKRFADHGAAWVLEQAKVNLATLDFVGLQEDMSGTLTKLTRKFSWRVTDAPSLRKNETPPYDLASIDQQRLRDALGDKIVLDEALYACGCDLYERM